MLASPFETKLMVKDITSWFVDRYSEEYERKVTARWIGNIIRKKLALSTRRTREGYEVVADPARLQPLYQRYGIHLEQEQGE